VFDRFNSSFRVLSIISHRILEEEHHDQILVVVGTVELGQGSQQVVYNPD